MAQQELSHLEKINNLKQSYINIKDFLDQVIDPMSSIADAYNLNDTDLQKFITPPVLQDVVDIGRHSFNYIGYLKQAFLDNGLRALSVLDPALNDNGKMGAEDQNQLANQMITDKMNEAHKYFANFLSDDVDLSAEMPAFLRSLNVDDLRQICGLTYELYSILKSIVPITIEDFLLQCKAEFGIEFEKL